MVVILFFIVIIPVYIPTNSVGGFPFLSPAFIICRLFDNSSSNRCEIMIIVVLICISLVISDGECLFMYPYLRGKFFSVLSLCIKLAIEFSLYF